MFWPSGPNVPEKLFAYFVVLDSGQLESIICTCLCNMYSCYCINIFGTRFVDIGQVTYALNLGEKGTSLSILIQSRSY